LSKAISNPGTVKIEERGVTTDEVPITTIPERHDDPSEAHIGHELQIDAKLLTCSLDKPNPQIWFVWHHKRTLRTMLVQYKPTSKNSAEWYYIIPSLEQHVRSALKPVNVHLLHNIAEGGEPFLWVVHISEFSPYHNAMAKIASKGDAHIESNVFCLELPRGARMCSIRDDLRSPEDANITIPPRPVADLLAEALGSTDRIIKDASHPIFVSLTRGRRMP
jgi:hypothetical protein